MIRNRINRRKVNRDNRENSFKIIMTCFLLSILIIVLSVILTNGQYVVIPYIPIIIGIVTLINRKK